MLSNSTNLQIFRKVINSNGTQLRGQGSCLHLKLSQVFTLISISLCLALSACSTTNTPLTNPENLCQIFSDHPDWHSAALRSQEKWRVPPQILFAIIYQESSFKSDVRPSRNYFLGLIPMGRKSSAYGYPQAKNEVWGEYERATNRSASRSDMADSLDFMGWYFDRAQKMNGVSKWNAYDLYLNYHEGMGGFARGTYRNKGWLLNTANLVKQRSERYGVQYLVCKETL